MISLPLSKSIAIRALAISYVGKAKLCRERKRPVPNPDIPEILLEEGSSCHDIRHFIEALSQLPIPDSRIYIGDGAAPFRFLLAIAAAVEGVDTTISLSPQLGVRPHNVLIDSLRQLGGDIETIADSKPSGTSLKEVIVRGGNLQGGRLMLNPACSSQFSSALLIISPLLKTALELCYVGNDKAVSTGYVEMTRQMIERSKRGVSPFDMIEYDWSAATYFFEWAFLNPGRRLSLSPLKSPERTLQPDSAIVRILEFNKSGVFREDSDSHTGVKSTIIQHNTGKLEAGEGMVHIDFTDNPDCVPACVGALCGNNISFLFTGVGHLRHKETDRLETLCEEFGKLGYTLSVEDSHPDYPETKGPFLIFNSTESYTFAEKRFRLSEEAERSRHPIVLNSHGDHRIAMALAPFIGKGVELRDAECVGKSFPRFFEEFTNL